MAPIDSFGINQSRTFVMPNPGGARSGNQAGQVALGAVATEEEDVVSGSNPIIAIANPILNMIFQIRTLVHNPDPSKLRNYLIEEIKKFEARAKYEGVSQEHLAAARYCLCTVIDETAAQTPWGGGGVWAKYSLLVTFHNETWGGEKFFQILSKITQAPALHLDLIELMFYCISLGFEGRYKVVSNGQSQLEVLRRRLAEIIADNRSEKVRAFSIRWQGVAKDRRPMWNALPVWVSAAIFLFFSVILYSILSFKLSDRSDFTFGSISKIHLPELPVFSQSPARASTLTLLLQPEIDANLVRVNETASVATVILLGDGLFNSGSIDINAPYKPVLRKIADAIDEIGNGVIVSGHTDSQPIRTARFPSNWHLSMERARSVAQLLSLFIQNKSLKMNVEGLGSAEPVASNGEAQGRALNRRVEIKIFTNSPNN